MDAPETRLPGGNVGGAVRVGDTVRRQAGTWTPAVHELLDYLEGVGFPYSPRPLGIDAQGREVLSFIEGHTVGNETPWPAWAWSDDTLGQLGSILREYHDAVRGFRPRGQREWRLGAARLGDEHVVCHNDIGPYNIVYRDGRIVGIIDWDLAGPETASWDLAFSAWTFAPIHTHEHACQLGAPVNVLRRIRVLCDAYGLRDCQSLLELIEKRMASAIRAVERGANHDELFAGLVAAGHLHRMRQDAALLSLHLDEWKRAL